MSQTRELRVVRSHSGLLEIRYVVMDPLGNPAFQEEPMGDLSGETIGAINHKIDQVRIAMTKPVVDSKDLI